MDYSHNMKPVEGGILPPNGPVLLCRLSVLSFKMFGISRKSPDMRRTCAGSGELIECLTLEHSDMAFGPKEAGS